ncbi:LAMI_0D06040g1_1 [Lachancea mirantina]|uniref:Replication protein A subunit n=1 Tax=Lachancea mirantina TaxID=1230905 RepID=A0A1G4JBE1_9SACH|nr:LAMI_0D06040g1_1 [Lachancea mirantina]
MSGIALSTNDLRVIFTDLNRYNNANDGVYQLLRTRKNDTSSHVNRKNLIVISDGVYKVKALLRNEAIAKAQSTDLNVGDVFKMTRGEPAIVKEKKKYVLLIDDLEVMQKNCEIINPNSELVDNYLISHPDEVVSFEDGGPLLGQATSTPSGDFGAKDTKPQQQQQQQQPPQPKQTGSGFYNQQSYMNSASQKSRPIFAIEQLSPYQNMWTIKARVSFKGDIKTWHNQRGEGKLFYVNLLDTSGEIRATAFNDNATKFYEFLQEGKVYYISKARIQPAKPQFSNLPHPYELQIDRDTVIEECFDAVDVPKMNFNFVKLSTVETQEPNSTVDVIGIIRTVHPHFEITSKAGKKFDRRDIVLVDDSGYSISVGLWNQQAVDFNLPEGSVLAIKGARVTDFQGKSLSMGFSSTLHPSPEVPEAFAIKGWYDAAGHNSQFHSLKQESGPSSLNISKYIASRITISKAQSENLGMSEKGDFFNVRAAVSYLKIDNFAYPACQNEGCNKKVIEESDGTWRCEKCNSNHASPQWRYMLTASIVDETGQLWITLFNEQAEQMLGVDASALMQLKETDPDSFSKTTQEIQMCQFDFRIRAREDNYNDQRRIRYTVANLHTLKYRAEADFLADELSQACL